MFKDRDSRSLFPEQNKQLDATFYMTQRTVLLPFIRLLVVAGCATHYSPGPFGLSSSRPQLGASLLLAARFTRWPLVEHVYGMRCRADAPSSFMADEN
jgi:hypothetical protein